MVKYKRNLLPPMLVNTRDAFDEMLSRLMVAPVVAVDTESNSLYAYTERVCLIQFSVPGEDYIVDPFAVEVGDLGAFFADPEIEKVFHAAEYDVMVLRRDFDFSFANLFDTMMASRIVGWQHYGLGALLEEHFGVSTDKRMRRTNWGKRPLSSEQLTYAQLDTHFLIPLQDILLAELQAQNRVEEARAAFARVAESTWTGKRFSPDDFWYVKGAGDLDDVGLAVLRALFIYRDRRAQALDWPPFRVLSDYALVALSRERPRSLAELGRIRGLPRRLPIKSRQQLLNAIKQGGSDPPPRRRARNHRGRVDEEVEGRYEALREWRNARSEVRGVEPGVILSNHTLRQLARHNPTSLEKLTAIDILNGWEHREYGREIVAVLRRQRRFE
jgi:ribonuclease D